MGNFNLFNSVLWLTIFNKRHSYRYGKRSPGVDCGSAQNKLAFNRPFNKLSQGASHMQIDAAVSEIQRLEHNAIRRGCTEIVIKCINNYASISKYFHNCLLNISPNNCAAGSCWSEQLCSRVLSFESFDPQMRRKGWSQGLIVVS